jgi:hypothetical protein
MNSKTHIARPEPTGAPSRGANADEIASFETSQALMRPEAASHGSAMQAAVHGPAPPGQQGWNSSQQAVSAPQAPSASAPGANRFAAGSPLQAQTESVVVLAQNASVHSVVGMNKAQGRVAAPSAGLDLSQKDAPASAGFALKAELFELPSGLSAQSVAKDRERVLAVDVTGAPFVSIDAGITWKAVTPMWSGRAVLVRFRTVPAVNTTAQGDEGSGEPSSVAHGLTRGAIGGGLASAGVFEIVTDAGQVWVSADGVEWKQK